MRSRTTYRCALALLLGLAAGPALAQSTGYVTGFPGKDPAGDEEIGWGPAYRPETSFAQPGTPPTPAPAIEEVDPAATETGGEDVPTGFEAIDPADTGATAPPEEAEASGPPGAEAPPTE